MAQIPCTDYIREDVPVVPKRIRRTNPDALKNRWGNFIFCADLSPEQRDELGAGVGAWSMWDIPASNAAQIDDDRGEDLIVVSVMDRVYWLDWTRFQDEWFWNAFAPIRRLLRLGPIPSNDSSTIPQGGYDLAKLKRFMDFQFSLKDGPTGVGGAVWTVRVAEWDREARTERSGQRATATRMRARLSTKGRAFIVTLEHSANEPVSIEHWRAAWDVVGTRLRESGVV